MPSITLTSPAAIAFHLGPIIVRWYGLIITAGFMVASWLLTRLAKRQNFDADAVFNCALVSFMGAIVGARLYFVALSWQTFVARPSDILQVWLGGLSIHGGIIGGVIAAYIYCRAVKLPFVQCLDMAGAVVPLGQAIGRWGNFFNSEAFGRPVRESFPIKLFVPLESRPAGLENFAFFQPTFLYESIWNLAVFLFLYFIAYDRLRKYPGLVFLAYLFLYSIGRACIEPLRTDSIMVGGFAAPLAVSCILVGLSGAGLIGLFQHYQRQEKKRPNEEGLNKEEPG